MKRNILHIISLSTTLIFSFLHAHKESEKSIEFSAHEVFIPQKLGDLKLYKDIHGFHVKKNKKIYDIQNCFCDPLLRKMTNTQLISFLGRDQLKKIGITPEILHQIKQSDILEITSDERDLILSQLPNNCGYIAVTQMSDGQYRLESKMRLAGGLDGWAAWLLDIVTPVVLPIRVAQVIVALRGNDAPQAPQPAARQGPAPIVQAPAPVRVQAPAPVVQAPAPVRVQAPAPVRVQAPQPAVRQAPEPVRVQAPAPVRRQDPAPARAQAPQPIARPEPAPVRIQAPQPVQRREPEPIVQPVWRQRREQQELEFEQLMERNRRLNQLIEEQFEQMEQNGIAEYVRQHPIPQDILDNMDDYVGELAPIPPHILREADEMVERALAELVERERRQAPAPVAQPVVQREAEPVLQPAPQQVRHAQLRRIPPFINPFEERAPNP